MAAIEARLDAVAPPLPRRVDVAIVGSGFSGLATAARLRDAGHDDFLVLERSHEVGGVWRDNTYPGCACDVPSHLYSLSFAPNPEWTSTFSPQPEIRSYLQDVARDHGLLPFIRFGCELRDAAWDADARGWRLSTSSGPLEARVLVTAAGGLSEPSIPALPGVERFQGTVFHSARWDHGHRLDGDRVAVVGTGASAIQFVPEIQPHVASLHVFQRTPPWVMPRRARPITRVERAVYRRFPALQRLMRSAIYWGRETYALPMLHAPLSRIVRRLAKVHLRRQVPDAQLRRRLTPDYAPGCKRILISNDYLPSLTRPNVEVVTDGIAEVRERSIVTADGAEREVDTIIFGTGFHVTDMPIADRIRRADGRTLADVWDGSPHAHKGTTVAGFPNLFFVIGPNTGLGHNSIVFMAEVQADYVLAALRHMARTGAAALEPRAEAQAAWNASVQRRMRGTVWTTGGCSSWYLDRRGRNSTLWPDFTFRFRSALRRFDADSYVQHGAPLAAPEKVAA